MTTVTDMMILNCAVGIDVAREGSQWNTQGVWPCKLLVDSLPLQFLDISPERLEQTTTPKISNDSCRVTHDKKQFTVKYNENEKNVHTYTKFDMYKIIKNVASIRHRVTPQGPVINLFGNLVTRRVHLELGIESVRL